MKKQLIGVLLFVTLLLCTGCASSVSIEIPYSSDEYESSGWTLDELIKHFEDLGFENVEVLGNTSIIEEVYVANEDDLFESFDKGHKVDSSRRIGIYTHYEPLNVETSSELEEIVKNGNQSEEGEAAWQNFLKENIGETIYFNGTIMDWYDKLFWIGVSFSIAIEDNEEMIYYQDTIDLGDLGMTGEYSYDNYYSGLITKGMRVYVTAEIVQEDDNWDLEIDSIKIIE